MFERLIGWAKGWWNKMIGKDELKRALDVELNLSQPMVEALERWAQLYENKAEWLSKEIRSLNLAAAVAGEIARSVTLEMLVEVTGSKRADFLHTQITELTAKLREQVEYGAAKGGLIFKPWPTAEGQIAVDCVQADQFYPVAFDSKRRLISCIFVDKTRLGDSFYTRLEHHELLPGNQYRVRNKAFKSSQKETLGSEVALANVAEWAELQPETLLSAIKQPLFAYFRFPQANNIDPASPLGVSCYARAEDLIKEADIQWSEFLWEFKSGHRAIYADELAFEKDKDGKPKLPDLRLYRTLKTSGPIGDKNELFKDWTPSLREENMLRGLDAILKRVEYNCGLAYGTLSDPEQVDKTATEILSSKQRSAATVVDTQKALQSALDQLLYGVDVWATLNRLAPKGKYEVAYTFDDSLVTDHQQQFLQDERALTLGVMSKVEFRMRTYGEPEDVAKQKVDEANAEKAAVAEFPEEE